MTADRDADEGRSSRNRRLVLAIGFVVALAIAFLIQYMVESTVDDSRSVAPPASTGPDPIAVEATSVYEFASLAEMTAASDAVVLGTVVATEPGRLVGDPASGGVISRLVTIEIDAVLGGPSAGRLDDGLGDGGTTITTIIVEEEGSLADGTPIIVNGVAPSAVGDHGVWFLDELDDAELPVYLVINSQGRFLADGDRLVGGDQRDPLVQTLQRLSLEALVQSVRLVVGRSSVR